MRILLIGDIVGKSGRRMVVVHVPRLRTELGVDMVIANGENAAGGNGLTHEVMDELFSSGIDVLTSGNHIFDKKEVFDFLDDVPNLLRPINLPAATPGRGYVIASPGSVPVAVINVSGRAFMPFHYSDPFESVDVVLDSLPVEVKIVVIDMHAETTSEKAALAWCFDGRVSVVVGTHTHVQTSDERILPHGTAFITDLGMTGPRDSVIGVKTDLVIQKLRQQMPVRFDTAQGPGQFGALLVDVDTATGQATAIERIFLREP
ncbi:MAG: TIGR00282 family metallophosphoesterase [Sulfobacillus sp.]